MTAWGRGEVNRSRVLRQLWSEGQIGGGNTNEKALQEAGERWNEGATKTKSGKKSKGPWGEGGRQSNGPGRALPPPPLCLLRTTVAGAARAAGSAQDHRIPAEDLRGGSKRGGCPDLSD